MNEDIRNKLDFFANVNVGRAAAAQSIRNFDGVQTDLLARARAPPAPAASTALIVTDGDATAKVSNHTRGTRQGSPTNRAPRSTAESAQRAPRAATPGVASAPPRGCFSRVRVPNPQHNVTLFGTFNDRTGVTCRAINRRIREGTTSEMVDSKVKLNGKSCGPMCLAYHVRGNCSENCGKAYDHVPYTDAEYQASGLIEWCTENWVADIAAPE